MPPLTRGSSPPTRGSSPPFRTASGRLAGSLRPSRPLHVTAVVSTRHRRAAANLRPSPPRPPRLRPPRPSRHRLRPPRPSCHRLGESPPILSPPRTVAVAAAGALRHDSRPAAMSGARRRCLARRSSRGYGAASDASAINSRQRGAWARRRRAGPADKPTCRAVSPASTAALWRVRTTAASTAAASSQLRHCATADEM